MWRRKAERAGLGGLLWLVLIASAVGQGTPPQATTPQVATKTATATFAGGCFWCVEADFDKVDGVISTISGYIGGRTANPSYEEVSRGGTGHAEAVEIVYDPAKVSYQKLLDVFWHNIDPLVKDRQFCDRGDQYRTAIFYHGDEQRRLAEASKTAVQGRFKQPIETRDRCRRNVLQGRGLSPGLLCEESRPLQILSLQLRTRRAARGAMGQEGLGEN